MGKKKMFMRKFGGGGVVYNDWYLPSFLEIAKCSGNVNVGASSAYIVVSDNCVLNGGEALTDGADYASSTELSATTFRTRRLSSSSTTSRAKNLTTSFKIRFYRREYVSNLESYGVGDFVFGGVVCFIDTDHLKIINITETPLQQWSNITDELSGANDFNDGLGNCNIIISQPGHVNSIALTSLNYSTT